MNMVHIRRLTAKRADVFLTPTEYSLDALLMVRWDCVEDTCTPLLNWCASSNGRVGRKDYSKNPPAPRPP